MSEPITIHAVSFAQHMACKRCGLRVAFDPFDDEAIAAAVSEFNAHACVPVEKEQAS